MTDIMTGTVNLQGAPLYYEVRGQGTPLVLIHAGVTDCRMWDAQWEALAADFRLVRFDLRGYGRSPYPDGPFSYHVDVAGLMEHLGIEQAHIAGVSFGGRVALDFALAHPNSTLSLFLGAPSIGGAPTSETVEVFGQKEEELLEADNLDAAADLNVRFWVDGPRRTPADVDPAVRQAVFSMQRAAFESVIPPNVRVINHYPVAYEALGEIEARTLIMIGDADVPSVADISRIAATKIPNARLEVRQNVGHMVTMERPDEVSARLRDWVRGG
jgi:pimeloyl-ACP methyl ester carboxylesterase